MSEGLQKIKRIKKNKTLVNGGLFSLYSFMGRGFSFLLLMLLANYMPPTEYGSLSLFNTVVSFVTIFMALSTEGYFSISFFKKSKDEFKKNFTSIYILGLATLVFFIIVVWIGGIYISDALQLSQDLLFYAAIISFLTFSFHIQQNYFRIQEKVVTYGYYNVGNALLNFVLSLFFVITLKQGWTGRVNAQLLCAIVFGTLSLFTFLRAKLFIFDWDKSRYKELVAWGLPMLPHQATGWIRQGLDRYIINYSWSTYEVGIFSFALNASNIIDMVGHAFNATNSVTLFQTLSDKSLDADRKMQILRKQTRNIGLIYSVSAVVIVLSMSLIAYFALPKYKDSVPYIWILSISAIMKCFYYLYTNYLFYYGKTKTLMYITFGTSVMHLLLSLALTRFSLYYTSLIYVLVQSVILYFVFKKSQDLLEDEKRKEIFTE